MSYWEDRGIQSVERMEESVSKALPELIDSFEKSKKELSKEVNAFYARYAMENKIDLAEAQKLLNFSELKEFKGNLKVYRELSINSIGTYNLELNNLSTKARITRLQALQFECDTILQRLYQQQKKAIESTATAIYKDQYFHSLYDIEQYTGFQYEFAKPSLSAVEQVLSQPVQGADISTRLWRQDMDTGFKIRQALNEMLTTGKPPQDFADNLSKIIGKHDKEGNVTGKKYEAYRLLYTESAYSSNQANLDAYKSDDVEEYEVIATLDHKTSQVCREYDGKHYPISKAITGENFPPFHVFCRTTTAPFIDIDFKPTRMARDSEGNSVRVTEKSYEEWYQYKIKQRGKAAVELEDKKAQNESSDFKQYEKYKTIFGKEMPKSFANFQELKYNNIEKWESFKSSKQETLNSKSFQEIQGLKGKLGNLETRLWYKSHDENIPNIIDKSLPLEHQARQASNLRCTFRTQARDLMRDQEERKQLDLKFPNLPFEYYMKKYSKPGQDGKIPTTDEIYKKIIEKSTVSNKVFDKKAGVKDEN